jgi:hypothetical protein
MERGKRTGNTDTRTDRPQRSGPEEKDSEKATEQGKNVQRAEYKAADRQHAIRGG